MHFRQQSNWEYLFLLKNVEFVCVLISIDVNVYTVIEIEKVTA